MSEEIATKIISLLLLLVSLFCVSMFTISMLDGFTDSDSIYALFNMLLFHKLYWGMHRYDQKVEAKQIEPSGNALLVYALFKFV